MDASHLFSETFFFKGFETTIIKDGVKVETPIMILGGNAENKSINCADTDLVEVGSACVSAKPLAQQIM